MFTNYLEDLLLDRWHETFSIDIVTIARKFHTSYRILCVSSVENSIPECKADINKSSRFVFRLNMLICSPFYAE